MKLFIASDIHGSFKYCSLVFQRYEEEKCSRMILLGDLLYHGPRNDLPEEYNPKKCIELYNQHAGEILCVRGNCDGEVDQMVLKFPVMADYAALALGEKLVYLTHGHLFTEEAPLPCAKGSVMLCGHTHVPKIAEHQDYVYLNSGSASIPKENSPHSYMIYEDGVFFWKNLVTGQIFQKYQL